MQKTIHTTSCHPAFIIPTEVEGSHFQISKLSHYKTLLFSFLFLLFSFFSHAQNYDWDWAISGGSPNDNESSSTGINHRSEQIYDVKIGSDGNYYYIATMKGLNLTQLNGQPVPTYNTTLGGNDIFLFSTDCDGQVRWSQAIGGGEGFDEAFNFALDSNNNVYVGVYVGLAGNPLFPVHFSPTETLPPVPANPTTIGDGWKTSFIVKYDHNGQYQWKKAVQGDVTQDNFESHIHDIVMDSQNNLHFIVGFAAGTHLDGLVTVPATFTNYTYQYYLVKFNTINQQFENVLLLPIEGRLSVPTLRFAYDEVLNRYYLAGMRTEEISAPPIPLSYDGDAFVERSFILAFNGFNSTTGIDGGEAWRREIYSAPDPQFNNIIEHNITSLLVDANSDVYIGGTLFTYDQNPMPVKVYDPSNNQVAPYIFTPGVYWNFPAVIKFSYNNNNEVSVQWAKTPTAYAANFSTPGARYDKGLVARGNEIAFGANSGYFIWDSFVQNPVQYWQVNPALMRFNKQTGTTVGMHMIESPKDYSGYITSVTVDNDGNYVIGGAFHATLFGSHPTINTLASSGGNDFFVAKLAASVCGTPVSVDKFNKLSVNVYPNPTNGMVTIETAETLSSYRVYDIQGRSVQNGLFSNDNQVNLQSVAIGTYFIQVHTLQGSTATVKVVKE